MKTERVLQALRGHLTLADTAHLECTSLTRTPAEELDRMPGLTPPRPSSRRRVGGGWSKITVIPATVSTFGAWHLAFIRWVSRRILRDRAAMSARDNLAANPFRGKMLWRVGCALSVVVQCAVFRGLAIGMPEIAEGAARLGSRFSEEPEYWRAFPNFSCIDWVTDELGLLPGLWDQESVSGAAGDAKL